MSGLPKGWQRTTLGQIVRLRGEKRSPQLSPNAPFIGLEDVESHTSRVIQYRQAGELKSASACYSPGEILYGRLRPYLNKVLVADRDGLASAEFLVLQPRNDTDAEFVRRRIMMSDFLEFTAGLDKGDRPRVDYRQIADFPIDHPPAYEQRRIVAKLDSLTDRTARAREELGRIPRLIQKYREAILSAAFSGELTKEWRALHRMPEAPMVSLGLAATDFAYGSSAKSAPTGSIPVLRMGNIQDGSLDWNDLVFTSDAHEIEKYRLHAGDVLFNRTNSPALVGKTALYKGERPAIYAGYLIRIRCSERLVPAFLAFCLNSPEGRDYCWQVKTDGVSQSNINAKKLAAFQLPLPTIAEQQEIVHRIETAFAWLDRVVVEHTNASRLLPKLDQAILAKAFRGELVPQDPNDEPVELNAPPAAEGHTRRGRSTRKAVTGFPQGDDHLRDKRKQRRGQF